jgi:hypothetical protein
MSGMCHRAPSRQESRTEEEKVAQVCGGSNQSMSQELPTVAGSPVSPILDAVKPATDVANSGLTVAGGVDSAMQAAGRAAVLPQWATPIGTGLSAIGGVQDVQDIVNNGATQQNVTSLIINGTGTAAGLPLGAASGPLAAVAGGAQAGTIVGQQGQEFAKRTGILGKQRVPTADGTYQEQAGGDNRDWSDFAADAGQWGKEACGDVCGGVALVGGTVVGTAGAAITGTIEVAKDVGSMVGGVGEMLAEGAKPASIAKLAGFASSECMTHRGEAAAGALNGMGLNRAGELEFEGGSDLADRVLAGAQERRQVKPSAEEAAQVAAYFAKSESGD